MTDDEASFLKVRRDYAQFCAENDIIPNPVDARYASGKVLDEKEEPELIARWREFGKLLCEAKAKLTEDEYNKYKYTRDVCREIGHWRHKRDIGKCRFICIFCVCMFDADPRDTALVYHGPYGSIMPGTAVPETAG